MDEMTMTEEIRQTLASAIRAERINQFGTQAAAYRAAGVNSMTWARLEAGAPVREDRMAAALKLLFPDSGGDWRMVVAQGQLWEAEKGRPNMHVLIGDGKTTPNVMSSRVLLHQPGHGEGVLSISYETKNQYLNGNYFGEALDKMVEATQEWLDKSAYSLAAHHNPGKGKEREARERDV